jgi:ribokinase
MGLQVGKDVNAELLKSSLSEAGVKLDHLREVDGPSGTAVILVQPSGGWSCSHAERME